MELETTYEEIRPIKQGQKVRVIEQPDGSLRLKVGWEIEDMVGILDGNGIHLTFEQIQE